MPIERSEVQSMVDALEHRLTNLIRQLHGSTTGVVTVASTATMPVPKGRVVLVTGVTNITAIATGARNGQVVTFEFAGVLTFTDGLNLRLAGNFVTTADDTITLLCVADVWYEVSRSVN